MTELQAETVALAPDGPNVNRARRWLAEVVELPSVLAYGDTEQAALAWVQGLALRVIAERLERGEAGR